MGSKGKGRTLHESYDSFRRLPVPSLSQPIRERPMFVVCRELEGRRLHIKCQDFFFTPPPLGRLPKKYGEGETARPFFSAKYFPPPSSLPPPLNNSCPLCKSVPCKKGGGRRRRTTRRHWPKEKESKTRRRKQSRARQGEARQGEQAHHLAFSSLFLLFFLQRLPVAFSFHSSSPFP